MSILLSQLLRAFILVVLGLFLIRYGQVLFPRLFPISGRLSRKAFAWRYILLSALVYTFSVLINNAILDVIVLPAYWFLQGILFLGTLCAVPFYISFISRRLQDLSISGAFSLPWVFFLVFAPGYGVVSTTKFLFTSLIIIVTMLLFFLPSRTKKSPRTRRAGTTTSLSTKRKRRPSIQK